MRKLLDKFFNLFKAKEREIQPPLEILRCRDCACAKKTTPTLTVPYGEHSYELIWCEMNGSLIPSKFSCTYGTPKEVPNDK